MSVRPTVLATMLLALLSACSPQGDFEILDKNEGPDEWEERRRQMNVTVVVEDPNGGTQQVDMDPFDVAGLVSERCRDQEDPETPLGQCPDFEGPDDPPSNCYEAVCQTHEYLCTAHGLLELAQGLTTQEYQREENQVVLTYKIAPQDAASNAGLTETAVVAARLALTRAGESLRAAAGRQASFAVCNQANDLLATAYPPDVTFGDYLANGFVEAYHLVREAVESAGQANIAAADAAFSEVRSAGKANRTAWIAPVLSRSAAAHDLVGGDDGLAGFDDTGVCPGPSLTPTTAAAVGLIETVAPDPVAVEDLGITVDELLSDDVVVSSGPIIQRYADLYGFDAMADMEPDDFLDVVGLTREDFNAARQYMASRSKAFERSESVTLARWTKPGGATGSFDVYAATARPPTPPPRSYYGVLARRTAVPIVDNTDGTPTVPTPEYADRGLAQTIDYAASVAFDLVGTTLPDDVRQELTLVSVDAARVRTARMQVCYQRDSGNELAMVRLHA